MMSEKPRSRKKHMVEGVVSEIERQEEGLGLEKVGENMGFLKRMIKRIWKAERNDNRK